MNRNLTLKKGFIAFLLVLGVLSAMVATAIFNLTRSVDHLRQTEESRYHSTLLATEYKNLCQAMTRDAMAFVSTEQPEFLESYQQQVAYLTGAQAEGSEPRASVLERIRAAGFTDDEMAALESAYSAHLDLMKVEKEAIETASGQFDDGQGGIRVALPNALDAAETAEDEIGYVDMVPESGWQPTGGTADHSPVARPTSLLHGTLGTTGLA